MRRRFFAPSSRERKQLALLSAIFMGEERAAKAIVAAEPAILFDESLTYRMPLLEPDGTPSEESEQIFHNVSPIKLMFYTGNWRMWNGILPLIPESMLEKTVIIMRQVERGGADLVRISCDPMAAGLSGKQLLWVKYGSTEYSLLCNPDGLFYFQKDSQVRYFYANRETGEIQEIWPKVRSEDRVAFRAFEYSIESEMIDNSSRRTNDKEYALIKRTFGIELVREGIHYERNGVHCHDTTDRDRLPLAYRRTIAVVRSQPSHPERWSMMNKMLVEVIGMEQRNARPYTNMLFLAKGQASYPLPTVYRLKSMDLIPENTFFKVGYHGGNSSLYPLLNGSGIGVTLALLKAHGRIGRGSYFCHVAEGTLNMTGVGVLERDLAMVSLIEKVERMCFKEWHEKLEQKLLEKSSVISFSGCGDSKYM